MPDWKSAAEIQKDAVAFGKLVHALLGLYTYEWFLTLDFDLDFLRGKRRFRWPMIFYFANRYLLLFALIGIVISLDVTSEVQCQVLYTFNQIAGNAAMGLASINLSIRTMAIWSQNKYIVGFLVLMTFGHWSLILQGVQLRATWVDSVGCVITQTNNTVLAATFIYSMCFDFIVLLLSTYKLIGVNCKTVNFVGQSRLVQMLFEDGLIFFMIASVKIAAYIWKTLIFLLSFLVNLCATTLILKNLNQVMTIIFNVPAVVAASIVACRAVRRLTNFGLTGGLEVYGSSSAVSGAAGTRSIQPAIDHRRSGL
ncbi:uncharacterized protein LACBIDRAFT_296082 [Laccaria bicolor S238N-H82]|uniref:Predicted protein n=1 Tax=Laccaria bicolor (strain S238N-H82 / ATCC MYA-4686) TaxID=486041 RepID=B0E2T8_LACBS|nr:uncharacterized protein LACBIDRAFT_296082 [Laccaria bicolor S238N-H82]EDQ98835.1 predicted protein [Laccaria bicolor S238N-H82]|eukprot:XP_001890506.1 predicted protein [Laccaria bicolor S238N-H82]